jgi:bifunctional non-homologous end joining protein LigD
VSDRTLRMGSYAVALSHEEKIFFPDDGITKGDLIEYYRRVADTMLPHVRGRPLAMQRCPDGIGGEQFLQKEVPDYFPDWISRVTVEKEGGTVTQVVCENAATLVYLANQACVTPHVWLSRADAPRRPDRLIFDLDPSDHDFEPVRRAARALGDLLRELGLEPFVMTTGSRGAHVVTPLDRGADFDVARGFARDVADLLAQRSPDTLTTEVRKDKRGGRLFLDTARNAYAQTGVAPYAVRARAGAAVATPLDWAELGDGAVAAQSYRIENVFRRLGQKADPWQDIARHAAGLGEGRARFDRLRRGASAR